MGRQSVDSKLISVVIVNYNCGEFLQECVKSVSASTVPFEIIVADNASSDNSINRLRDFSHLDGQLKIHRNTRNLGFAKAANLILPKAYGDFVLLLNPDCVIQPDTLKRMIVAMDQRPDVGMAGCLIRNGDDSEQKGSIRELPTPWRAMVRVLHLDRLFPNSSRFQNFESHQVLPMDGPIEVDGISGAFMLVRPTAIEHVGALDEGYFLHCEDLDWFVRFRKAGWKILYVPDVEIVHHGGASSTRYPLRILWHKHKGMVRFYRKFFRHAYPLPLMWLVIATVWVRFLLLSGFVLLRLVRP